MFQQKSRILALDLLRGLASLGIVIFHVLGPYFYQLRSLYFLVDFFFVLSGFVLARAISIHSWEQMNHFIRQRAKRIFPMAICALVFAESLRLAPLLLQRSGSSNDFSSPSREFINFAIALLLLQVFSHSAQLLLFPLWSLSAEWITNIVGVFFGKIIGKWQMATCILIGITLLGSGLFTEWAVDPSGWVVNLGRCFLCFGTGQLIHKITRFNFRRNDSSIQPIVALLGVIAYYMVLNKYGTSALILAPLPFGYLVWVYGKGESRFGTGGMKNLSILSGQYSYGVYVWHIPALGVCDILLSKSGLEINYQFLVNILQLAGTLSLSIFFTYIVLRYVEKAPFAPNGLNSSRQERK